MIRFIRTLPAALILLLSILGAAPDTYSSPSVVVYPLTVSGGGDPSGELGSNIAVLISNKLADLGGLSVKPYVPGTARAQYLDAALKQGADYYVTGYLTPVGGDVSMIVQVVSTSSGSIVFSTTAIARTYADAVGQADVVRQAILRHAGRAYAAIDAPAPAPTPAKADLTNNGNVDITKALGRRKRGAAPSPSPAPGASGAPATTVAAAPARPGNVLVLQVAGTADAQVRTYAASSISLALRNQGIGGGLLPVTVDQGIANAAQLCSANAGSSALYAPKLVVAQDSSGAQNVQLDVAAYDCKAKLLGEQHVEMAVRGRGGIDSAIDRAAGKIADAFLKTTAH
jgi:TolB-like protein